MRHKVLMNSLYNTGKYFDIILHFNFHKQSFVKAEMAALYVVMYVQWSVHLSDYTKCINILTLTYVFPSLKIYYSVYRISL